MFPKHSKKESDYNERLQAVIDFGIKMINK